MADYCVVRTDKMTGTDDRAYVASAKYYAPQSTTVVSEPVEAPIENGSIVAVTNQLVIGGEQYPIYEREVFRALPPVSSGKADGDVSYAPFEYLYLVASPEVFYDEHKKDLKLFRNEAGDILRCYKLHDGDIFSVTAEGFSGDLPEEQSLITLAPVPGKMMVGDIAAQSDATPIGRCIEVAKAGSYTFYAIQVSTVALE